MYSTSELNITKLTNAMIILLLAAPVWRVFMGDHARARMPVIPVVIDESFSHRDEMLSPARW